uniref:ATP synthase subunit a n=1 Tax=Uromastyx benti TaxID=236742 RepID=D6RR64_9SAUR|nr:ATP synthase F0 subunit 6 [Uromastyx benti]BAJ08052.1 ATPase subunit 6 [Uromastyx benti]
MKVNLFDQFMTPKTLGADLLLLTMLLAIMMLFKPTDRLFDAPVPTIVTILATLISKHMLEPINPKAQKWAQFLAGQFLLIATLNLIGMLPYTFAPTTHLSVNMALAMPAWLTTVVIGASYKPTSTLAHLLPENTPILLIPIIILIETISQLMRPLALAIRLTANLIAGHVLMQLISTTMMILTVLTPMTLAPLVFLLLLLLTTLELAVAIIQAYVFTLLLALYLHENT